MGTVTVIYGHAYDGKHRKALETCRDYIRRNAGDCCLYLVRSDVRARQLRAQVLHESGGCFHFPVATLPDHIKRLYRQSLGARREISGLEQTLLLEDIFRQRAAEAGSRFCFHRFSEQQGIVKKVQDFLIMTRRYGIVTPQQFEDRFRQCSPRRRALYDELHHILRLYTNRLDDMGVIDETGIFLEMAQRAESEELELRPFVVSPEFLVLEGYYQLTLPEQQIFSALCRQFERAVVTIDTALNPYAVNSTTPKPFRIFHELQRYIHTSGFSIQQNTHAHQPRHSPAYLNFIKSVFKTHSDNAETAGLGISARQESEEPSDFFTVSTYRNKTEEVTAIAGKIRQLFQHDSDIALRDIGVTFAVVEQYEQLISEIFPLFGIPFSMAQGRSLAASPVVVTVFRLLEVVLQDYSRDVLSKLLMSPFAAFLPMPLENVSAPAPIALDAETFPFLDTLARSLGIVSGNVVWQETLTEYTELLQKQRLEMTGKIVAPEQNDREKNADSENDSAGALGIMDETLELLANLLPALSELFEEFSRFETDTPLPVADWIAMLKRCITRFQLPLRVLQAPNQKVREMDAAAFSSIIKMLDMLKSTISTSVRCSLQEFYDLLRRAVQQETYYAPESLDDAVWIMGHLDTRHVQFQYLFFGGLIERDFPGKADPNIFLSEQETELFGLPTYTTRIQETDHLFYANLLNATRHLYLSHPAQEGDKDLLKAVYIENILRWQREHSAPDGLEPLNAAGKDVIAPLESIYTYADLLRWLGAAQFWTHADSQMLEAVLTWLVAERGQQWGHSFIKGIQRHAARNADDVGEFDEMLLSNWAHRTLRRHYERHIYSSSEFDLYARCPIRFFFERILRLTPLHDRAWDIPRQDVGNLLHQIVYRFYAESPEKQPTEREGNVDVGFLHRRRNKSVWFEEAKTRLAQIVHAELESYDYSGVFWDQFTAMLLDGLQANDSAQQKHGLLLTFAEQEAAADDDMLPWFVHANFGVPRERLKDAAYRLSDNPLQISMPDAQGHSINIAVRGQIDRIDVERETETEKRRVVVYDYKTGAMQSIKKIRKGTSFQLPLYILAAQEFLGDAYDVVAAGYYQLAAPDDVGKKAYFGSKESAQYLQGSPRGLLDTQSEFRHVLDECKGHVLRVAEAIRNGAFHPSMSGPQEAGCSYCPYQQICRVNHQRI